MARPSPLCYLDRMHLVATVSAALAVAACVAPTAGGECQLDAECDGEVCARDGTCTPASAVRAVTTTWTVRGAAADDTTCASHPTFYIAYLGRDYGDRLGYAPVPCALGRFTIDKLPTRFRAVELGVDGGRSEIASFGSSDTAAIDFR